MNPLRAQSTSTPQTSPKPRTEVYQMQVTGPKAIEMDRRIRQDHDDMTLPEVIEGGECCCGDRCKPVDIWNHEWIWQCELEWTEQRDHRPDNSVL